MFCSQNTCPWPIDESNLWHHLNQLQEALMNHDDPCTDTHTHRHCTIMFLAFFHIFCHILSFERWCFCVFGGIWGHLRHVANFLADACWGHASTTVTREGKSQRHRWHVGFQHVYTMFVHTMCVLYMYYILYGQLFKRIGNYTLTYSEVYWTWSLNMIIQHDF